MWKVTGSLWLVLGIAAGLAEQAFAGPLGTVTIADGRAHLARATAVYTIAEGVTIEEGDLLDLEEGALVQIELTDGSALSFTSRAQAMLPAPGVGGKPTDLYLAAGWAKFNLVSATIVSALGTPQLRLVSQPAAYVVTSNAEGTQVFVESGELVPVFAVSKAGQPVVLKSNEFVGVKLDSATTVAARAPQAFVAAMPRLYMDKLPVRLGKLRARNVAPKLEREASFADVDAAFKRYPQARAMFVEQFRPRLADKDFARELEPAIKSYPEWELALRPEKPARKGSAKDKPKAPAKAQ